MKVWWQGDEERGKGGRRRGAGKGRGRGRVNRQIKGKGRGRVEEVARRHGEWKGGRGMGKEIKRVRADS